MENRRVKAFAYTFNDTILTQKKVHGGSIYSFSEIFFCPDHNLRFAVEAETNILLDI